MICRNCGTENADGVKFCTSCGAPFIVQSAPVNENAQSGSYGEAGGAYSYQQPFNSQEQYYGNPGYAQQPPYGGYYAPPVNDKIATVKDYLKWMLLYPLVNFIPGIGSVIFIVLCIKYAFDDSFKARANYFKAMLIVNAITVGAVILICFALIPVFVFLTDSAVDAFQDFDPSVFYDGNFEYYFDMLIR